MPAPKRPDYGRPSTVPQQIGGTSDQGGVITTEGSNGGFNWMLDYQGNIRKRPGSQLLAQIEDSTGEVPYDFSGQLTYNYSTGPYGAGVLLRRDSASKLAFEGSDGSGLKFASEEIVICGSEFFWRISPVVVAVKTVTGGGWQVTYDGTDKVFKQYLNDAVVNTTTIGFGNEATPVTFDTLATAIGATAYSDTFSFSGVPAGYLPLGERIVQGNAILLVAYYSSRIATSAGLSDGAGVWSVAQPCPQTRVGISDANWCSTAFNGALYFAGRKKPLIKYDGTRTYCPGTITSAAATAGSYLAFGLATMATFVGAGYNYRLEHRVPLPELPGGLFGAELTFDRGAPYDDDAAALQTFSAPRADYSSIGTTFVQSIEGIAIVKKPTGEQGYRVPMTRAGQYTSTVVGTVNIVTGITKEDGTPHDLLAGDPIFCWNPATSTGTWTRIYRASAGTIVIADALAVTADTTWTLDSVVIYRTVTGGSTYYKVKEVPTYMPSGYTDTVADGALISNESYDEIGFTPINAPSATTAVCVHQNRLLVAHDSGNNALVVNGGQDLSKCLDVAISEPLSDQFSADTGFTLEDTKARDIRAMAVVGDVVVIFTDRSIWTVTGDLASAETFQVQLLTDAFGAASNGAVQVINGALWCLTTSGSLAIISGGSSQRLPEIEVLPALPQASTAEIRSQVSLEHAQTTYDPAARRLIIALPYLTTRRYLSSAADSLGIETITLLGKYEHLYTSTVSSATPAQSITYVVDFNHDKPLFYYWKGLGAAGGLISTSFGVVGVSREQGSNINKAAVWLLDDKVALDRSEGFEMRFQTGWEDLGDVQRNKRPVRLQLLSGTEGTQNFSLDVKTEQDWLNNVPVDEFTASFKAGEGYADGGYGDAPYGDGNEAYKVYPLAGEKCKSIRLTLSNSDPTEHPLISGWSYEIAENDKNVKET